MKRCMKITGKRVGESPVKGNHENRNTVVEVVVEVVTVAVSDDAYVTLLRLRPMGL